MVLVFALGGVVGCQTNETTRSTATPVASAHEATGVPRIKGTLASASTSELWKGGGVVYVEDASQPGAPTSATMEIRKREFVPSIAVVTRGGSVTFVNHEALTHHIFSPDIHDWDTGYLKETESATRRFDTDGAYGVLCNIHPEMGGWVVVVPSAYFGKVSAGGEYVIGDIAAGTYKVTAWAPHTKPVTQSVTVGPTGVTTANFEMR
jgi:plastocyanin